MKKSLIALAVLAAASGAAMAQSSVTLYGIADAYVGNYKNGLSTTTGGTPNINAVSNNVLNSGGLSTSRWGVRGTEDLGGGLAANFQLEQGIKVDDGAAGSTKQFDRQAWVGLSGGFGAVKLGRTTTTYDALRAATNNTADYNLSVTGDVFKAAADDYTGRLDNMLQYTSPKWNNFSAGIDYALGENKTLATSSTDAMSFNVTYSAGPLLLGVARQSQESVVAGTVRDTDYTLFAGSYDFGSFKVTGGYNLVDRDTNNTEDTEYQIGVSVPYGATTVYVGYANAKTENAAGVAQEKANGVDVVVTYAMSKRTMLYAGVKSVTEENGAGVKVGKLTQTSVGLRHAF